MKSKTIIKNIIGCIVTLVLTIVLIQFTGHMLDPDESEEGLDVIKAFDSLEDNSLDVIVYGSSHAWKGCDTRVMYDRYGISAYNYGCNWQAINTILLFLKDSLRTQSPKVVCIETGLVDQIEQDVDLDGQIYYTRQMSNFDGKKQYLKQCFGDNTERYISYYIPLTMFHENWSEVGFENFWFPGPDRYVESRGYNICTGVNPFEIPDYETMAQKDIPGECVEVLIEISKVCKDNDVNLILYTCPYAGTYSYNDALEKFADENDCAYLNLFKHVDEMGLDSECDLQDNMHLNETGSGKVAAFLAEYIIDNYEVENSVK